MPLASKACFSRSHRVALSSHHFPTMLSRRAGDPEAAADCAGCVAAGFRAGQAEHPGVRGAGDVQGDVRLACSDPHMGTKQGTDINYTYTLLTGQVNLRTGWRDRWAQQINPCFAGASSSA
jgi:hypothetical protein